MTISLPTWALVKAIPQDREREEKAYVRNHPDNKYSNRMLLWQAMKRTDLIYARESSPLVEPNIEHSR